MRVFNSTFEIGYELRQHGQDFHTKLVAIVNSSCERADRQANQTALGYDQRLEPDEHRFRPP